MLSNLEKALQVLQKAQDNFEQAQQEVMQDAPLPVMPVPQVNVSLVKTLEALTGIIEKLWNPDAGQAPENLIHAIQESRQLLYTSSVILSQEGGAALDAELDAGQDLELWDLGDEEAEEMADFEEAHAPGGPPVKATMSRARKATTGHTPITPFRGGRTPRRQWLWSKVVPNPRRPRGCQVEPCSIPETQNFWRFRNVLVRSSQLWQVPEILHRVFYA